jgi:AcrR family transcriptional regulator
MGTRQAGGRPRRSAAQRPGDTAQEQILDAAAELFTSNGYAATSTRAIAEAAGLRQPSLYYYFPSKDSILARLLQHAVGPALAYARRVVDAGAVDQARADARLYALLCYDIEVLRSLPWNLGVLYTLPEIRAPRFAEFRAERDELKEVYRGLVHDGARDGVLRPADPRLAGDLLFGLTESILFLHDREYGRAPADFAADAADSCLRLVAVADLEAARTGGLALRALLEASPP